MRKNIIAFIAIVIVSMSLTACGNNNATAYTIEYREDSSNSQNQTNNDDSSNISEKDPMQDPVHQGNANIGGGEGQSSCNPQDYWEGDDFFDIEAYALANGSVYTYWCDWEGNYADKNHATACTFYFSNAWRVTIYDDYLNVINNDTMTNYLIVYEKSSNGYISVCRDNSIVCSKDVIQAFNTVVECLKTSSDKADPFEGSGLVY